MRKLSLQKRHIDVRLENLLKNSFKKIAYGDIWSGKNLILMVLMDSIIIDTIDDEKKKIISRTTLEGGSIIIWFAFKKNFKSKMTFVNSRINAAGYQQMLHDYLLPFITLTKNDKTIFQQMFPFTIPYKKWFQDFGIELLWQALSSEEPIETIGYSCEESLWSGKATNRKYCRI